MMLAAAEVDACVYSAAGSWWRLALGCAVTLALRCVVALGCVVTVALGRVRKGSLGRRAMVINASPRGFGGWGVPWEGKCPKSSTLLLYLLCLRW